MISLNFIRCNYKICKEKCRLFAGDAQTLRNKRHFFISVIVINMFTVYGCPIMGIYNPEGISLLTVYSVTEWDVTLIVSEEPPTLWGILWR